MQTEFIDELQNAKLLDLPFVFNDEGVYFSGVMTEAQREQIEALYQQHYQKAE